MCPFLLLLLFGIHVIKVNFEPISHLSTFLELSSPPHLPNTENVFSLQRSWLLSLSLSDLTHAGKLPDRHRGPFRCALSSSELASLEATFDFRFQFSIFSDFRLLISWKSLSFFLNNYCFFVVWFCDLQNNFILLYGYNFIRLEISPGSIPL